MHTPLDNFMTCPLRDNGKVPVRYRWNAASGGWSRGCSNRFRSALAFMGGPHLEVTRSRSAISTVKHTLQRELMSTEVVYFQMIVSVESEWQ